MCHPKSKVCHPIGGIKKVDVPLNVAANLSDVGPIHPLTHRTDSGPDALVFLVESENQKTSLS